MTSDTYWTVRPNKDECNKFIHKEKKLFRFNHLSSSIRRILQGFGKWGVKKHLRSWWWKEKALNTPETPIFSSLNSLSFLAQISTYAKKCPKLPSLDYSTESKHPECKSPSVFICERWSDHCSYSNKWNKINPPRLCLRNEEALCARHMNGEAAELPWFQRLLTEKGLSCSLKPG